MAATTAAVIGAVAAVGGAVASKRSSDKAIESQENQNLKNEDFIERKTEEAKQTAIPLFDAAQQARAQGIQGALDVFGQSVPQQAQTFQQGNLAAQQAILAGLPQIQNAILGQQVDLSALQPQQVAVDTGFTQQQLPQTPLPSEILAPPQAEGFSQFVSPLTGRFNFDRFTPFGNFKIP